MSNVAHERHDDNAQTYRARAGTVAYARPHGPAMIRLEAGELIRALPTYVTGWLVWIEDGGAIGYLRLDDLERAHASD